MMQAPAAVQTSNKFVKGLVTSGVSVSIANLATMPMGKAQPVFMNSGGQCLWNQVVSCL